MVPQLPGHFVETRGYAHPGLEISTPASPSAPRANRRQSIHSRMYCHEPGLTWVHARCASSSGLTRKKGRNRAYNPSAEHISEAWSWKVPHRFLLSLIHI
eukprot:5039826-Amphidinium_carterae.1